MPLPFILGAAAAAAAVAGIKKGYEGYQKKSIAEDITKEAQQAYDKARSDFDKVEKKTDQQLESLGKLQLKIGTDFAEFKKIAEELLNKLAKSSNKDIKINVPPYRLNKVADLSLSATTYMTQLAGAGVAGAAAAYATYGGVMALAAASTGTPIAALSGAAAYNATMAAIGGGALSAGGLGMAGGAAILGGVVAAPIIAVAGFAYDNHAEEALENARDFRTESARAVKKLALAATHLKEIDLYAAKIEKALQHIYAKFTHYFEDLKRVDLSVRYGGNIEELEDATLRIVENGYLVAALLTDIIDTPLFVVKKDSNGNPILKDKAVQLEVDANGQQIINKKEIDADIQTALNEATQY
ncbi:chemotaxis protein [Pelistega sp. NLN82]|uniref:Chemotaxis protein n=1 Tax=Pelistega ratti TaxID=2652177 RepID=A0A6L9Y7Z2_9BURK|nr:chemotaxis protein [Pelistega ratti]NEN76315.1 chemotaxis protein [Pelistega ratti]